MTTLTTDPRHGRALIWQRALQRWLTRSSVSEVLPCLYLGGYLPPSLSLPSPSPPPPSPTLAPNPLPPLH